MTLDRTVSEGEDVLSTTELLVANLAELPTAGLRSGAAAFVSDGAKRNEALDAGTGTPAYADVVDGVATWRRYSDDLEVNTSRKLDLGEFGDLITPQPHGAIYTDTVTATAITDTSTFFPIVSSTALVSGAQDFDMTQDGRLRYTGARTRQVHVMVSLSPAAASNNQELHFAILKNGIEGPISEQHHSAKGASDHSVIPLSLDFSLATNDYLEVGVRNVTSASNVTVDHMIIIVFALPN